MTSTRIASSVYFPDQAPTGALVPLFRRLFPATKFAGKGIDPTSECHALKRNKYTKLPLTLTSKPVRETTYEIDQDSCVRRPSLIATCVLHTVSGPDKHATCGQEYDGNSRRNDDDGIRKNSSNSPDAPGGE
jgi:hypothetical protein